MIGEMGSGVEWCPVEVEKGRDRWVLLYGVATVVSYRQVMGAMRECMRSTV